MTPRFLSGLVLGAGSSTRLGQPKQLLPYRNTTLLEWVVTRAESSQALDELVVVLGAASDQIHNSVCFGSARVVENPQYERGCSASYKAGIGAVDPRSNGLMILLGDQPEVDDSILTAAARAWRQSGAIISLCSYRGRLGHPMIFSRALYPDLVNLHGDKAAWKLVDAHAGSLSLVSLIESFPGTSIPGKIIRELSGEVRERRGKTNPGTDGGAFLRYRQGHRDLGLSCDDA